MYHSYLAIVVGWFLLAASLTQGTSQLSAQTITVALDTPDSTWRIKIERVYEVFDELWIVARVQRVGQVGAAVITRVSDSVKVQSDKRKFQYFVLGKDWNWQGSQPYQYVDEQELTRRLEGKPTRLIVGGVLEKPLPERDPVTKEVINVEVVGRLTTGVMAVGGETTGFTISAGNITWELDFGNDNALQERAEKNDRRQVSVAGVLRRQIGTEVKERWLVRVLKLEPLQQRSPSIRPNEKVGYIVSFHENVELQAAIKDHERRFGFRARPLEIINGYAADLSTQDAEVISADSRVNYLELDGLVEPNSVQPAGSPSENDTGP